MPGPIPPGRGGAGGGLAPFAHRASHVPGAAVVATQVAGEPAQRGVAGVPGYQGAMAVDRFSSRSMPVANATSAVVKDADGVLAGDMDAVVPAGSSASMLRLKFSWLVLALFTGWPAPSLAR